MSINPTIWTSEQDAILKDHCLTGGNAADAALRLGMSEMSVRGRAERLGLKFGPARRIYKPMLNKKFEGHKAADERSAEILRQHGINLK